MCLSALPRQRIELLFDDTFYIEASFECRFDHIEVRDGPFSFSPLINRFCGSANPGLVLSSGRFMWIRFFSDEELEGIGFQVQYSFTAGDSQTVVGFIDPCMAMFSLLNPDTHSMFIWSAQITLQSNISAVIGQANICTLTDDGLHSVISLHLCDFPLKDPEFHLHVGGLLNPIPGSASTSSLK